MARTILPRSVLKNSAEIANTSSLAAMAPDVPPIIDPEEPGSQPSTQPSSQPSPKPGPPTNPDPRVVLIHRESIVRGPGLREEADGPIWARDPLAGADRVVWSAPRTAAHALSLYNTIGRLVLLLRYDFNKFPLFPTRLKGYRVDFFDLAVPAVGEQIEFEAPAVVSESDLTALVQFAKFFQAPKLLAWNYAHGGEVLLFSKSTGTAKKIEKSIKPYKPYLLANTPAPSAIEAALKSVSFFEIAAEWFEGDSGPFFPQPSETLPKTGAVLRSTAKKVPCAEGDYSKVDFNAGAPLQLIEVTLDPSIPMEPVK